MLAFILAIAIGLASLVFFFSAFFAPKLHRKDDFLWSGIGFFYALVLWICATRITGGVLLGQGAAVVLILSFTWQTLKLRAAIADQENRGEASQFSLLDWFAGGKRRKKVPPQAPVPSPSPAPATVKLTPEPESPVTPQVVETLEVVEKIEAVEEVEEVEETLPVTPTETPSSVPPQGEAPKKTSPAPAKSATPPAPKAPKSGFLSGLFKKKSKPASPPPTLTTVLADTDTEEDWEDSGAEVAIASETLELTEPVTESATEPETSRETASATPAPESDPTPPHPEDDLEDLDDLLEDDPLEEDNPSDLTTTPEPSSVPDAPAKEEMPVSTMAKTLETYEEDLEEFEPYLGGNETATLVESESLPVDPGEVKDNSAMDSTPT